jgi:hypothetical protein
LVRDRRHRLVPAHDDGALSLFGVPPEEYWAYEVADFDKEPTAFCYAFAPMRVNSASP